MRKEKRYDLRVHYRGDFGPGIDEDVQDRHEYGHTGRHAAERFAANADRCWIEVMGRDGRVIYTLD